MKFDTVAKAFNFYRGKTIEEMEARAKEIGKTIDTDEKADIEALNIELRGIKEARENSALWKDSPEKGFDLITGMETKPHEKKNFGEDVFQAPEYRSAFFKSLLGQGLSETEKAAYDAGTSLYQKRASGFTSATDAVAVLPTKTLNEIVKKARTQGGLLAECRSFSIPSKISIPIGTPSSKASWHTEGADVESEKVTPASVVFDGYEIIKIFSISTKARLMTIDAFESYLVDELAACVMDCINDALINGNGSGQGTGIIEGVTWSAENTVTAAKAGISYADVIKAVAMLKRGYANGAKWLMNNATLYNHFYGMVDGNKRPIFITDPQGQKIGRILGFNVVIDDYMPDDTAILGNYGAYMGYNMPEGIVIEASRESSFKKGLIDYRALAIADCKPIVTEAFVKLEKASA